MAGAGMVTLSAEQERAVRAACLWHRDGAAGTFRLGGYAGSGKSTIIPHIVEYLGFDPIIDVCYVAPTGKAALVMTRKLRAAGIHAAATTIHKAIYKPPLERKNEHDSEDDWLDKRLAGRTNLLFEPLRDSTLRHAKLVICDEASMVGEQLAGDMAIFDCPILAIGDPGQLPPVEEKPGFNMAEPSIFLSEIHRQALDNPVIRLANDVRNNNYPRHGVYSDGVRVVVPGSVDIPDTPEHMPTVITGTHKRRWAITAAMRDAMGFEGHLPQTGERVICCKNSRLSLELVNGTEAVMEQSAEFSGHDLFAVVARARTDEGAPLVPELDENDVPTGHAAPIHVYRGLFDEHIDRRRGAVHGPKHIAVFKTKELEHLDFGWAITCHKSQGSQWDDVLVIDESHVFRNEWKRWLYTAITRAAQRLTIVTG